MKTEIKETINLPRQGVRRLLEAMRFFELAQNEIEDFLLFRNESIMGKIKKARKEHLEGKVKDFQGLIKKYV